MFNFIIAAARGFGLCFQWTAIYCLCRNIHESCTNCCASIKTNFTNCCKKKPIQEAMPVNKVMHPNHTTIKKDEESAFPELNKLNPMNDQIKLTGNAIDSNAEEVW